MKAILFYLTAIIAMIVLMSEVSLVWILLVLTDIALFCMCKNVLSMRDVVKYSGYKFYYKHILPRKERPFNLKEVDLGL